jgi:hypothetical protein
MAEDASISRQKRDLNRAIRTQNKKRLQKTRAKADFHRIPLNTNMRFAQ